MSRNGNGNGNGNGGRAGQSNGRARTARTIRCAIYTRKSTEEGLEQDFNSLDAQRESAEAYIASQKAEGWVCLTDRYDDGGYTGGNMERPALQRLLADIEAGKIDCVVVYKVDRLSRSLPDFARVMETFEKHHVAFVSVTQQFNTSTSMGRLMLNVLLSFAQFEREIISERTRDKIAAARRRGKWSGGPPVLGYDILREPSGSRLVVNPEEAERVRYIFGLYPKCNSVTATSATFLSKVEKGEFAPPAPDRIKKMAELLGVDGDELLALADKVDPALSDIIKEQPKAMADFLRTARDMNLSEDELRKLTQRLRKQKE